MSSYLTFFTGEISALTAALFWAIASIYYADIGTRIGALNLNLIKGVGAVSLMTITLLAGSLLGSSSIRLETILAVPLNGWLLLLGSGLVGIAIGDTAYFACLKRIGPQKGLMLESTSPIIAALLALWLYGEQLPLLSWSGIALTTFGVILVVKLSSGSSRFSNSTAGILFGLLAATGQAAGIVFSRMALDGQGIEPLAGGLIRLGAGVLALGCWLAIREGFSRRGVSAPPISLTQVFGKLQENKMLLNLGIAIFLGTYLAIWLQQLAVKFTSAGSAQALLATCPLFGILMAVRQGYRQPRVVWLGLAVSICGIFLLFQ